MIKGKYLLAIETAVRGGSLSLLKDGQEIGGWVGNREVSKAEDVLEQISRLLEAAVIRGEELDSLVVSRGPGSFTGARIGISTAMGLRAAWNCRLAGVSSLAAMTSLKKKSDTRILTAVPIGEKQVAWQIFNSIEPQVCGLENHPRLGTVSLFLQTAAREKPERFIVFGELSRIISGELPQVQKEQMTETGDHLARLLGQFGSRQVRAEKSFNNASDNDSVKAIYLINESNLSQS